VYHCRPLRRLKNIEVQEYMMQLALLVAPQRNTQYGNVARALALPELQASPLGPRLVAWERRRIGRQDWLLVEIDGALGEREYDVLDRLGSIGAAFEWFDDAGERSGPLLRPLTARWAPFVPIEFVETRRYRGKTNELFTFVLINLALFASDWGADLTERLRILDPLAGGGTTLFAALTRGYDAFGIEQEKNDIDTTDAYVRQFFRELGLPCQRLEERVRGVGRRVLFTIGRQPDTRQLGLAHGDTVAAPELLNGLPGGARFHAIVADLPYGIQHQGQVRHLLEEGVPAWASALLPGGALTLAWDASSLRRPAAITLIERQLGLRVLDEPSFNMLEHAVDRQIKHRDVLVVRKEV
jgi:SAM-dependent methyltransferase